MEVSVHIEISIPPHDNRRQDGVYMWVDEVITENGPRTIEGTGYNRSATRNRLTLLALIEALEHVTEGTDVKVYTDSRYIISPITEGWIYRWASDGWARTQIKNGRKYYSDLENVDLWQRMYYILDKHQIQWTDERDSYREYMKDALRRNRKQIEIDTYKAILEGGKV